jgi:hypothetical protein
MPPMRMMDPDAPKQGWGGLQSIKQARPCSQEGPADIATVVTHRHNGAATMAQHGPIPSLPGCWRMISFTDSEHDGAIGIFPRCVNNIQRNIIQRVDSGGVALGGVKACGGRCQAVGSDGGGD